MFELSADQEITDADPKDFSEYDPQNKANTGEEMIDKVDSNKAECELACMKIETCTFYQYHYITSPPLLAATNCLYVRN